ncbi:MAG: DUF3734 domain-containing protein [Thermomonas sp.]|uniref:patatin-like phospholipase family protein n=1 Tax=Thermomonas sp. TaxID=1971895 RepID=UPI001EB9FB7B|nr:patatin-like phospholipase family protein [Thermomonas sp.]MBV2209788.1 DUF3734 domain-containing protein [Thermomonas sp.]
MPRTRQAASKQADGFTSLNALVLQGGGALGAYQGGAYEALAARPDDIDWVAGISIGAINAAIIAGNPKPLRVERLRAFWDRVGLRLLPLAEAVQIPEQLREWWDAFAAQWGAVHGVPGFFSPRPWWEWWPRMPVSVYDTAPLRETLLQLVDFELLNHGPLRYSVGAVDVETGNFVTFDSTHEHITVDHVLASGALPPGFAPVKIHGRHYWDGGLVSNTPLSWLMRDLEEHSGEHATVFQVDLFSARGQVPQTLLDVAERSKDIQFSSRTRMISNLVRERHELRHLLRELAEQLSPAQRKSPQVQALLARSRLPAVTLVHVIHHPKPYETHNKDYEFSRLSIHEHWQAGQVDMAASLGLLGQQRAPCAGGFCVIDYQSDGATVRSSR